MSFPKEINSKNIVKYKIPFNISILEKTQY